MSATRRGPLESIGVVYVETSPAAVEMMETLRRTLTEQGRRVWICSSRAEDHLNGQLAGTDAVLVLGGDGTIISVARICSSRPRRSIRPLTSTMRSGSINPGTAS